MSLYQLFLYLHIIGAIVWLGAGLSLIALAYRSRNLPLQNKLEVIKIDEWFGQKIFSWSGMLTLLAGFGLVGIGGRTELKDIWILASLISIAASMTLLTAGLKPLQKKIVEISKKNESEAALLFDHYQLLSTADLLLLLFVVYLMVFKPNDFSASLLVGITLLIVAEALVWWKYRTHKSKS